MRIHDRGLRLRTVLVILSVLSVLAVVSVVISVAQTRAPRAVPPGGDPVEEAPFLAENAAAMDRMMAGMSVKPSGNIDADFSAMMIPHHQGAIDMALAELRYGKNEQLRRIAQEIIVDQQQEIAAMRLALGQPLPPSAPAPTEAPRAEFAPICTAAHGRHAHDHAAASGAGRPSIQANRSEDR